MKFEVEIDIQFMESPSKHNCYHCFFVGKKNICDTLSPQCEGGCAGFFIEPKDDIDEWQWTLKENKDGVS